nr:hypothetical protein [Leptolyngbyaceae cyanobacterium MAG.088]
SSPHKEYNPIQERLNSLEPSLELPGLEPSNGMPAVSRDLDEAVSGNGEAAAQDAISPHDEPLVGPLS